MPDRANTVKGLTEIAGYMLAKADIAGVGKGKEVFDRWYRAADDALELLKAQEAVKPMLNIDTWVCGNCGERIERQSMIGPNVLISETLDACPNCGKKVKWDE